MKVEKIGFIGLGNMGYPMAKNLEKSGFDLCIYNRSIAKTEGFEKSTTIYSSVVELINDCDIVFTMLTNDDAVKAVYSQIYNQNLIGKLFVDMSTISPEASSHLAKSIKEKAGEFLDAPVAGSTKPAAEGTLIIMVGGTSEGLLRALPYLEKMGKSVKFLGENGKGIAAKLAVNYFLSMIYQGLAETVLFAENLGIQRSDMLEIINESASGSGATKVKTPLLEQNDYAAAFSLDLMLKDILLAKKAGADFPLTDILVQTYQSAHDHGFGKDDVIGVVRYLKTLNKDDE